MNDIEIDLNELEYPARFDAYEKARKTPRRGVKYTSAEGESRQVKYARPTGRVTADGLDVGVSGKPGYWLDAPEGGIGTRFIDVTTELENPD